VQIEQEEEESAIDAKRRKRLGECLHSNSSVQQLPCGGIYDSCISCRAAAFAFSVPSHLLLAGWAAQTAIELPCIR